MKKYISDEIGVETYGKWLDGKKIIINAPTGTGKTTFVLKELLPYCKSRGKKMLILCNRRLLKLQYGFELAEKYVRYAELIEGVDVRTYQALAEVALDFQMMEKTLKSYDVIICDEVHFFYSDSDFNAEGTYILLQKIIKSCFFKTVVMITATLLEVLPMIETTFRRCECRLREEGVEDKFILQYKYSKEVYDFQHWADYSRFDCYYVRDVETLASEIANSKKKSLIFIDDKQRAEEFKKMLVERKLKEQDIFILSAEVMEEKMNDRNIQVLAVQQKMLPRVVITTSVLDNGVSIHDAEMGNIVIATDSRVSFLQMIGRIRSESTSNCKLFIYPRDTKYFEKRLSQYEERLRMFEEMEDGNLDLRALELLRRGWFGKDNRAECLRDILVITEKSSEYFSGERENIYIQRGEVTLAVNAFAKEKIGNMLLEMKRFYKLSMQSQERVAQEQISWIGKMPEELCIIDSSYRKERERALKKMLLEIQQFSLDELIEKKKQIAEEYSQDVLKGVVTKRASFSTDKLETICRSFGLCLVVTTGEENKNRYSIKEVKEDEEN